MSDVPEPDWQPLRVVLRQTPDGWAGTMSIGATSYNVRGWGKTSGVVHAEVQPTDAHHEAFLGRLFGAMEG